MTKLQEERFISLTFVLVREDTPPKQTIIATLFSFLNVGKLSIVFQLYRTEATDNFLGIKNFTNLINDHTLQLIYKAANKEHQNMGYLHSAETLKTHISSLPLEV